MWLADVIVESRLPSSTLIPRQRHQRGSLGAPIARQMLARLSSFVTSPRTHPHVELCEHAWPPRVMAFLHRKLVRQYPSFTIFAVQVPVLPSRNPYNSRSLGSPCRPALYACLYIINFNLALSISTKCHTNGPICFLMNHPAFGVV